MISNLIVPAILTIVAIVIVLRSIRVVPSDSAYVVERLGRYFQTLRPGLHMLLPFLDRVAFRYSLLPKEEQLTDRGITFDNIPVSVSTTFRWEVVDPQAAAYNTDNVNDFVLELVRSRQRQWIAERRWNDVRESTRELQSAVLAATKEPAAQAGVRIADMQVKDVQRAIAE